MVVVPKIGVWSFANLLQHCINSKFPAQLFIMIAHALHITQAIFGLILRLSQQDYI